MSTPPTPTEARQLIEFARRRNAKGTTSLMARLADALEAFLPTDETERQHRTEALLDLADIIENEGEDGASADSWAAWIRNQVAFGTERLIFPVTREAPGADNMNTIIVCEERSDCKDKNINRWHCMRGHEGAAPGGCPLAVCIRRGANAAQEPTAPAPSVAPSGEEQ